MHPITTRRADCKDCYRCVRVCPVKAISVKDGQAKVLEDKCILCGKCVLECPQNAKIVKSEVYKVRDFLSNKSKVVLSIAPSFPAYFTVNKPLDLLAKIKGLGFYLVEETSIGARYTSEAYHNYFEGDYGPVISSCCPVVVNLIEIFFPELLKNLAPVASPAIAHGLSIKERFGWDTKVVFAGPCIAKMVERGINGRIDAVLTFSQLAEMLKENEGLNIMDNEICEEKVETRLFPLPGGTIRSFMGDNLLDYQVETISGLKECMNTLEALKSSRLELKFVELMACRGGCIAGPEMDHSKSILERKRKVIDYYNNFKDLPEKKMIPLTPNLLDRYFKARPYQEEQVPEGAIRTILAQIGKYSLEDEKNCGGCGYKSCREKAMAVYRGYAELEMCMSYMKTKAESTAHTIVHSTPNGIIVFDHKLEVKEINPAAKSFFTLYGLDVGHNLADCLDVKNFLQAINTGKALKNLVVAYEELGLWTRQIIVPMDKSKHSLYMVIITDITESVKERIEREQIKEEILSKAHLVINNQMLVAQQIAGLLGETTAETKIALLELIKYFNETERKSNEISS
ncbi:MAG: [Fe-Fe] hydrogenase large subunit C-terminal domain-containing protein [Peptococcales bacterium]|jgi:iron only hydrogenase large subunit-like protein